ncbi:hypothetical protein CY652_16020 [Burkholderia sp. WAC0059]|nr:hypothetical protein CY652_16020 [Burkholderia sp. WAC0059]
MPIGGQAWQRRHLDEAREAVERSLADLRSPLAELHGLAREAHEHRVRAESAVLESRSLFHLLDFFDAMGRMRDDGVVLQQVVSRREEIRVQAVADSEDSVATWLARLRTVRTARGAALIELKRGPAGADRRGVSLQLAARVFWTDPSSVAVAGKPPTAGRGNARTRP